MKKILLSSLVVLGVAALAVGATRAFFSETETIESNTFTSSSFDVTLGGTLPFNATGLQPGDVVPSQCVEVQNTGDMDMIFRMYVDAVTNDNNISNKLLVTVTLNPTECDPSSGFTDYGPPNLVLLNKVTLTSL